MSNTDQSPAAAPPEISSSSVPDIPAALDVAPAEPPPASDAASAGTEAPGVSTSGAEVPNAPAHPGNSEPAPGAVAPETQESQPADAEPPVPPAPPPADAPLVRVAGPTAEELAASTLIEAPVQGAALERGEAIPPPEAQPMIGMDQIQQEGSALVDAVIAARAAAPETVEGESSVIDAEVVIEDHSEHPLDTIDRIRAKLMAYGVECLKTIQPEIEYLISLVDDDRPARP